MSLLEAPTTAPLAERLPWLEQAASTLLEGATGSVAERIAACAVLAGATGRRAIEALVAGLDDSASRVRLQAVASLAASSSDSNALRLAHAALHRRTDVRRAALQVPELAPALVTALLGDPRLVDEATAILVRRAAIEPAALNALVVARRQGLVTDAHVAEALRLTSWSAAAPFIRALPAPPPPPASTALATRLATMGDDHLIDVMTVVADNDDIATAVAAGLASAARRRVLDVADLERVALAVAVVGAMRGSIHASLVAVAAVGDLDILDDDAIDIDTRRAACRLSITLGSPRHDDVFARVRDRSLWQSPTGVDLGVLAGLQRLCRERPTALLVATVDPETLARAFSMTPTPSLLSLPPTNTADRAAATALMTAVATALCARDDGAQVDIAPIADVVVQVADPLALIDILDATEPGGLARLLIAVLEGQDHDGEPAVLERRLERVIEVLVRRLDATALSGIVRLAAQRADHRSDERAVVVVAAIARLCPLPLVITLVDGLDGRSRGAVLDVVCANVPPLPTLDLEGDGLLAVLHRRAPGGARPLDDQERAQLAAASSTMLGRLAFSIVAGRRRSGLCAALQVRPSLPGDPLLVAALLASHDPPAIVAAALAAANASSSLPAASALLATVPSSSLPLLGLCAVQDDDIGPLVVEVSDAPGGFRGVVTLALQLAAPVDVVVLEALVRLARSATFMQRPMPSSVFDDRLRAVLAAALEVEVDGERLRLLQTVAAFAGLARPTPPASPPVISPWSTLLIDDDRRFAAAIASLDDDDKRRLTAAALLAGTSSARLQVLLRAVPPADREPLVRAAMRDHHDAAAMSSLLRQLPMSSSSAQVQRLREVAAWGARQATTLVGRPLGVTWIGGALGFTRLGSSRIHINPLPVLLDERDGADIVMGLMAHELGHHRYHGDVDSRRLWEQAHREQLGQVLNLVADEHLERNLRALSPSKYGRRLQVLAAWAFQHRAKELDLATLLTTLGARAAVVLGAQRLGVARIAGAVVVDVGSALGALEQQGSAFSRFMRALRMGKGDRFNDPLVARGLALFAGADFRTSSMAQLLDTARALRRIFGEELGLLQAFDFHKVTDASDGELVEGGVGADDLDSAGVEPRHQRQHPAGAGGGTAMNVDTDTTFSPIAQIERVAFDLRAQQALVASVRRPVEGLRRVLLTLGEASTTQRRRLRGGRVDRTSLVDVVTRGDPRLLVARERQRAADLFIGVAVDCSGSMRGERLDRARHFAAVIAGAARDIAAVDVRFFGFSDNVLYDAGDARRCAVASLDAHDGNNDAAALSHIAGLARRSARRVKLLVMISDGAPTECSVDALRALVTRLGRRGMICAQVAVAPLEEICFPHHVVVDDDDLATAARRFGAVVERLIVGGANEQRSPSASTTTYTFGAALAARATEQR